MSASLFRRLRTFTYTHTICGACHNVFGGINELSRHIKEEHIRIPFWWGMGSSKVHEVLTAVENVGIGNIYRESEESMAAREKEKVKDVMQNGDDPKLEEQ